MPTLRISHNSLSSEYGRFGGKRGCRYQSISVILLLVMNDTIIWSQGAYLRRRRFWRQSTSPLIPCYLSMSALWCYTPPPTPPPPIESLGCWSGLPWRADRPDSRLQAVVCGLDTLWFTGLQHLSHSLLCEVMQWIEMLCPVRSNHFPHVQCNW